MKYINGFLTALVLLSPFAVAARTAPQMTVPRDSVVAVAARAEAGDPAAINTLGMWYYTGENLEQDYTLAARFFARAAKDGDVAAIGNLGLCYQYGNGVEADSVKAMGLYTKSLRAGNPGLLEAIRANADRGSAFDCAAMGYFLTEGIGCKTDYALAAHYYAVLAARGDVNAMRDAGLAYLNAKDYKNSVAWFKKGALAGELTSTYYYGRLLCEGLGVNADPTMGFVYILKAAESGMGNAEYYASKLYREGRGVAASAPQADRWLRTAAYHGLPRAIYDYSLMQASRNEFVEASFLFSWLKDRRSFVPQMQALFTASDTTNILSTPFGHYAMALAMIRDGKFKDARKEIKAIGKAGGAISDVLEAQMLLNPAYDKHDVRKAVKMLTKAAEKDNYARVILGGIYERGAEGVEPDSAKALEYYNLAAADNFAPAFVALGNYYYEGLHGGRDTIEAVRWYRRAFESGYMTGDAANRYITCLNEGEGTPDNPSMARKVEARKYPAAITDFISLVKIPTDSK